MKFRPGKIYTVRSFPTKVEIDAQTQGSVFQHADMWFKKINLNKVRCLGHTPTEVEEANESS